MADTLTKEKRSWNMSRIAGKNTKPENFAALSASPEEFPLSTT